MNRHRMQFSLTALLVITAICGVSFAVLSRFYRPPTVLTIECLPGMGDVYLDNTRLGRGTRLEFSMADLVRLMRGECETIEPGEFRLRQGEYGCLLQQLRKRDGSVPLVWVPANSRGDSTIDTPFGIGKRVYGLTSSTPVAPYVSTIRFGDQRHSPRTAKARFAPAISPAGKSRVTFEILGDVVVPEGGEAKAIVMLESRRPPFHRFLELDIEPKPIDRIPNPCVVTFSDSLEATDWLRSKIILRSKDGKQIKSYRAPDIAIPVSTP